MVFMLSTGVSPKTVHAREGRPLMKQLNPRLEPSRARQAQGQALVWFLATVAACAAVLYGVYNVGQVTSAKQKVVNAADAGALAGAIQEARVLNLMAYGNRSMVVSDALVAQMISLDSWMRFVQTTTQNLSTVTRMIPVGLTQVIAQLLQTASRAVEQVEAVYGEVFLPGAITALEARKKIVMLTNESLYASGAVVAQSVSSQVVSANRTSFGGRTDQAPQHLGDWGAAAVRAENLNEWRKFSKRYAGGERDSAAFVVQASRDEFSMKGLDDKGKRITDAGRNGNALTNLRVSALGVRLEKRGGTRLIGFDRWEAQDTLDLRSQKSWWGGWRGDESTLAIGWGRVDAGSGGHLQWGGTRAQIEAIHQSPRFLQWSGISVVRDLTDEAKQSPTLGFMTVAFKPRAATPTTGSMGVAPQPAASVMGSAQMSERLLADQVSAISVAQVYFERPQRGMGDWTADAWSGHASLFREDAHKEYPSLYSPFWQARLAPVKDKHQQAVLAGLGAPALALSPVFRALP